MNITPTVGVLISKKDKVLLVRHEAGGNHVLGTFGIPAGKFEPNETPVQVAIRELEEETGLICTEMDLEELPIKIPPADLKRKDGTINVLP